MNEQDENKPEVEVTPDIFAEVMEESQGEIEVAPVHDDPFDILLGNENHPNVLSEAIDTETPIMQQPKPSRTFAEPEAEPSRTVKLEVAKDLQRAEEIEAELVKTNGRYIESVDNVKVGKTIYGDDVTKDPNHSVSALIFARQQHPSYIGHGFNTDTDENSPLDTGAGAHKNKIEANYDEEINDPRSKDFLVCMNSQCQYRETCVRYRLQNQRPNKAVFFPEQCRLDGTYISIDDTSFTGYDNMSTIEDKVAPTSLGEPE